MSCKVYQIIRLTLVILKNKTKKTSKKKKKKDKQSKTKQTEHKIVHFNTRVCEEMVADLWQKCVLWIHWNIFIFNDKYLTFKKIFSYLIKYICTQCKIFTVNENYFYSVSIVFNNKKRTH